MKKATKVFLTVLSICLLGVCLSVAALAAEQAYAVYHTELGDDGQPVTMMTFCVGEQDAAGVERTAGGRVDGIVSEVNVLATDFFNTHANSEMYWGWSRDSVEYVEFLDEIKPTTTGRWFYHFENLTEIRGLENLNTENVTNMQGMFEYCKNLKEVDVSTFDTSKVTNMNIMFGGCATLTSLDLHNFNTEAVTDMNAMFARCTNLETLDISSFDTRAVTDNGYVAVFSSTKKLSKIKLGEYFVFGFEKMKLPIPETNDTYTGYWTLEGNKDIRYTAEELLTAYDGATMAGTWTWEKYPRLEDAEVTVADALYTGEEIKPEVTVVLDGKTLVEGVDYTVDYSNNIEPGTATVTITAIGDYYKGEVIATFKITKTIADAKVDVSEDNADYTGEPQTPDVTVTLPDGTVLVKDVDYTVDYEDNVNPGEATVKVTGIGNYSGEAFGSFTIIRSLSDAKVTAADKVQFCKNTPATTKVTVIIDGKVLKKGVDYTVTYLDNDKPGFAKVIITGIGAYKGQTETTFEIVDTSDSGRIIKQQSIFRLLIEFLKKIFAKLASIC